MSAQPDYSDVPLQPGQPLSDSEKRLKALSDEMEKNQLGFLDQAGKPIGGAGAAIGLHQIDAERDREP